MRNLILLFLCSFLPLKSKEILSHQFIDFGNGEPAPALFYVCLKKEIFHDPTESFWNYSLSEVVDSGDIFESNKSSNNSFYLGVLPCTALGQQDELPKVEEGFFQNNYFIYDFDIFLSDSENYSLRKKISMPEETNFTRKRFYYEDFQLGLSGWVTNGSSNHRGLPWEPFADESGNLWITDSAYDSTVGLLNYQSSTESSIISPAIDLTGLKTPTLSARIYHNLAQNFLFAGGFFLF